MPKTKNSHQQPTKEELEEKVKDAQDIDLEEVDEINDSEDEDPRVVDLQTVDEEETPEEPSDEDLEEIEEEETEEKRLRTEIKEKEKKLSASARENQKIYAKNRVINQALVDADEIPEPTEDELIVEYPDWDAMSDTERKFAKETVMNRKWREVISKAKEQATKIEKWNDSISEFLEDPNTLNDNPLLEGKTEAFREFATKDENNSVPMGTLVKAFLYESSTSKKINKGRMFERGSSGPNEKPKVNDGSISLEEARQLRKTDYNKWKEYNKAGKIRMDF